MSKHRDEWITGTVEFKVGGEILKMQLTVPVNRVAPRRMLPVFQKITDAVVDLSVKQDGQQISCRAGCGACCRQLVPISQLEADNINDFVAKMPKSRRDAIRLRFSLALEKLAAAGLLAPLRVPEDYPNITAQELGVNYFRLNIACPFLENESCSIHSARPLACREYLVTSPAANCADPTAEAVRQVPIAAKLSNAVIMLSERKENSPFIPYVPLILALEFAANNVEKLPADTGQNILKRIFTKS